MTISRDSLRGYILEEVLAFLIRNAGYKLLVDPSQDSRELDRRGNGLVVKGRGGVHQVDVLGQLEWVPAFTFPLRLFVEAKFRQSKTGIDAVRNAVGTVIDINQNNFPLLENDLFLQRYHYAYALFSTSGFSNYALKMALAHQISLIDLSGEDFADLRDSIDESAFMILSQLKKDATDRLINPDSEDNRGELVSKIRYSLENMLGIFPQGVEKKDSLHLDERLFSPVLETAKKYNELFVAMANGPFILLLKADDNVKFLKYAANRPSHRVRITWDDDRSPWVILPLDDEQSYRLTFALPDRLKKWVFEASSDARERALTVKKEFLSNITIYRNIEGKHQIFCLTYIPQYLK